MLEARRSDAFMAFLTPPPHKTLILEEKSIHWVKRFVHFPSLKSLQVNETSYECQEGFIGEANQGCLGNFAQHLFFWKGWWIKCIVRSVSESTSFHEFHCVFFLQKGEHVSRVSTWQAEWECYLRQLCSPILVLSGCHKLVPCVLPAPEEGEHQLWRSVKICQSAVFFFFKYTPAV